MKKYLNAAIIGTGFIGKQHIEAIRRIPYTRMIAASECNKDMLDQVCGEMAIENGYTDYREMLEKEEIDIIHNCTPSGLHYQINKDVIESGRHIYCEKPLTLTTKEAKDLVDLARRYGVKTGANFNYRNNVMVREMRERIRLGGIGTTLLSHGEYLQDWLMYDADYDWRMNPEIGGITRAVSDIGSHCFDTIQFVLGKKITAVNANLITVYPVRKRTQGAGTFAASGGDVIGEYRIDSDDAAYVMVRFEDGTQGFFNISQVCAGKKNGLMVNISGSRGSLEWRQEQSDRLFIGKRDWGNEEVFAGSQYLSGNVKDSTTLPNGHPVGWADAFCNGIKSFYETVRSTAQADGKDPWHATFEDACYVMAIVEACLESSRKKSWVEI